ncbi:MAG: nucleotidyltransferase [Solirubrobacterales bacterium]
MKVTGVIVEYNPMHNGHLKHIELCKKFAGSEAIVAVLSGNFVQRGMPALLDKWTRAKIAINNGIDLVIELPAVYSLSSAEFFGSGAVGLLNSLGIIDNLCFGSEFAEIDKMLSIAEVLINEPQEYKSILKMQLDLGNNFSSARNIALNEFFKHDISGFMQNSNNILGIEYCKALLKLKSSIMPVAVKRIGSDYNQDNLSRFSSATSIRKYLKSEDGIEELKNHVPLDVFNILKQGKSEKTIADAQDMIPFIKYKFYTNQNSLKNLPDVTEGIEKRIFSSIEKYFEYEELISNIKTKRYAYSRISRILCQFYAGFDSYNTDILRKSPPAYARILGFNNKGAALLRKASKTSSIPLITKVKKGRFKSLDLDIQVTNSYSLLTNRVKYNQDFYNGPVIL